MAKGWLFGHTAPLIRGCDRALISVLWHGTVSSSTGHLRNLRLVAHRLLDLIARPTLCRENGADEPEDRQEDPYNPQHPMTLLEGQVTDCENHEEVQHKERHGENPIKRCHRATPPV